MKKALIIIGILLLVVAVVLILFGFGARSLLYGVKDAPHSTYDRYFSYTVRFFAAGSITAIIGIVMIILGIKR